MDGKKYVKLSQLVDSEFTVAKVYGFKWKRWEQSEGRMIVSDSYKEGFSKKWAIETEKGELELSDYQFSMMLTSVFAGKASEPVGRKFTVKSNGKQGQEVRYWIRPVWESKVELDPPQRPQQETILEDIEDEVNLDDIPF